MNPAPYLLLVLWAGTNGAPPPPLVYGVPCFFGGACYLPGVQQGACLL